MSIKSSPHSWTRTIIKPRNSNDLRYLFRSPEGKLIFDQQLVGKLFNIVNDRLAVDGAAQPHPSTLEEARAFVQVQLGDNLYTVSYLRSDGTPQLPEDLQTFWHALQKPNGDWCFVPKSQTTIPEDWPPPDLHNEAQPPAAQTTAEPEESEELKEPEKPAEPEKPKQAAESNVPNPDSSDAGDRACNSDPNYPITHSPNYQIPEDPNSRNAGNDAPPKSPTKFPPSDILDFLESTISQYLVCSPAQRSVLALWILHTYIFQAGHYTPYLNIYSPLEESGKSTCMTILRSLCARPWWAAGVSPATFKSRLSDGHPTVLLDNWQTVFRGSDKNQFTGFLLNGCDQAHDAATFDASQKTNFWQTFCPKAFAGLESLPPSLARHSIPIVLQRRKPLQIVKSALNLLVPGCADKLTSWMQRWAKEHRDQVADTFDSYQIEGPILPSLSPHQQNCARVLLAIAQTIGGHWPQKACAAFHEIFLQEQARSSSPTQLLSDIRDAFAHYHNQERIFTAELLDYLHDLDDRTWYEYSKSGKPMTPQALSRILGPCFKIYSRSQRRGTEKLRGYQLSDFLEAWERYLPDPDEDLPSATTTGKPTQTESTSSTKSTKSTPSTKSTSSTAATAPTAEPEASSQPAAQDLRHKKTTPKPRKPGLVSMSHSNASPEKIKPKTTSMLKNFAARTLRIFTAIWS